MSHAELVTGQIRKARMYTKDMLGHVADDAWFRQPTEGVTHVAWQVGHLAVAQYNLALLRMRGEADNDAKLIPKDFRTQFGKGSVPVPDARVYPSPDEIRGVFNGVYDRALAEIASASNESLNEPAGNPHPMFKTKLEALEWCAMHEFIHAGQIALLRRLFGAEPLR
ncbi:MAG: DinB family protein [Pirellulales bacterium]|nr:DinB family protein [Pirellulales bacterium]